MGRPCFVQAQLLEESDKISEGAMKNVLRDECRNLTGAGFTTTGTVRRTTVGSVSRARLSEMLLYISDPAKLLLAERYT